MDNIIRVGASVASALALAGVIGSSAATADPPCPPSAFSATRLTPCFTPEQDCEAMIVSQIDHARHELLLQTYKFTNHAIFRAMARAKQRGVNVRIILDDSLERKGSKVLPALKAAGIEVRIDASVKTAHDKIVVADRQTVVTGSFNFTQSAAKRNAENILIAEGAPQLAAAYARNWMARFRASRPVGNAVKPPVARST